MALTKIQQVAQAICCGDKCTRPDDCWGINGSRIDKTDAARRAIKAMKGPTERMASIGAMFIEDLDPTVASNCFEGMLEEALAE